MQPTPPKSFLHQKSQCLAGVDWSRKGSIDEPIEELVKYINDTQCYFTTSSCSGRICVYEQNAETESEKQGCRWLLVSHTKVQAEQVHSSVSESIGDAYFKYEAFVMHVQCWRLEDAQQLHAVAVASGFRNSGITVGKKGKIIVGVRSTHGLEAPVTLQGSTIVDSAYLIHLAKIANDKLDENFSRINRFFENLKAMLSQPIQMKEKKKTIDKEQFKAVSTKTQSCNDDDDDVEDDVSQMFEET